MPRTRAPLDPADEAFHRWIADDDIDGQSVQVAANKEGPALPGSTLPRANSQRSSAAVEPLIQGLLWLGVGVLVLSAWSYIFQLVAWGCSIVIQG